MARDVFISYGKPEKAIADAVCAELESVHHVRCWIAPRDIPAGDSWTQASIEALARAKVIIPIFRSDEPASAEVDAEVQRALKQGINVVPLRVEVSPHDRPPTESGNGSPPRLDVSSASLRGRISRLAERVCALLEKPVGRAAAAAAQTVAIEVPAAAVPPRGPAAVPVDTTPAAGRPAWMLPALIGAGLLVVAILFGLRLGDEEPLSRGEVIDAQFETPPTGVAAGGGTTDGRSAPSTPQETPIVPAPADADPGTTFAAAPDGAPQPERSAQPETTVAERRPAEPVGGTALPAVPNPAVPAPDAATVSSIARQQADGGAAALPTGTLLVDFVNSLQSGSIEVEVDGKVRWTEQFTLRPGGVFARLGLQRVSEQLSSKLEVAAGEHQITVTVLTAAGEVRDYGSTTVRVPSARAVTLRITFSRFRNKLELESAVG